MTRPGEQIGRDIRLYENLHLGGRLCLSNDLNDGVVDEAKL